MIKIALRTTAVSLLLGCMTSLANAGPVPININVTGNFQSVSGNLGGLEIPDDLVFNFDFIFQAPGAPDFASGNTARFDNVLSNALLTLSSSTLNGSIKLAGSNPEYIDRLASEPLTSDYIQANRPPGTDFTEFVAIGVQNTIFDFGDPLPLQGTLFEISGFDLDDLFIKTISLSWSDNFSSPTGLVVPDPLIPFMTAEDILASVSHANRPTLRLFLTTADQSELAVITTIVDSFSAVNIPVPTPPMFLLFVLGLLGMIVKRPTIALH